MAALDIFLENGGALIVGDPHAGIADEDRQIEPLMPTADKNFTLVGVADGVGQEIPQDPGQKRRIADHRGTGRHHLQEQSLAGHLRPELHFQAFQHIVDDEGPDIRLENPGVKARHVEQGVEHLFHGGQGLLHRVEDNQSLRCRHMGFKGRHEQRQGLQRLTQVMTGRGKKAGFRAAEPIRLLDLPGQVGNAQAQLPDLR